MKIGEGVGRAGLNAAMTTATFFEEIDLIYIRLEPHINATSLAARMAEWVIAVGLTETRRVLLDARQLQSIERLNEGIVEFLNLHKKLAKELPLTKDLALIAHDAEGFVIARAFEQAVEAYMPTDIEVFRDEKQALRFLGEPDASIDAFVSRLGQGVRLP